MTEPWLARFMAREDNDRWFDRVHNVKGWSVATNRQWILAYLDGGVQHWPAKHKDAATRQGVTQLTPFLNACPVLQFRCSLISLVQWCEFIEHGKCSDCWGRGCIHCVDGYIPAEGDCRPGYLGGVRIDRNKLAYLLAPELWTDDHEEVEVSHQILPNTSPNPCFLFVDGTRFRIVLMHLQGDQKVDDPTFHPDPLYAELWAGREDPVTQFALADWLMERGDPYANSMRG